jgi:hypothetical protein
MLPLHRVRGRLALVAPLVALVMAVAQLGAAIHLSAVHHAVCAEHGEVVDVASGASVTPPRTALFATARHGHEHCALEGLLSPRVVTPMLSGTPLAQHRDVAQATPPSPPRAIAILHVAPKSSPPSRSSRS